MAFSSLMSSKRTVTRLDGNKVGITFSDSSAITHAVYNIDTQELGVTWNGDRDYVYTGVPASVVLRLIGTESAGRFMNDQIKGRFSVRTVERPATAFERLTAAI